MNDTKINIPKCYRLDDCQYLSIFEKPNDGIEKTYTQYRWVMLRNKQLLQQRSLEQKLRGQLYCDMYKGERQFGESGKITWVLRGVGIIPTDKTPYYPPFVFQVKDDESGDLNAYVMNSELLDKPITMRRQSFAMDGSGKPIWGVYTAYYKGDEYNLVPIQCDANKQFTDSLFPDINKENYTHRRSINLEGWIAGVY